MVEASDQAFWVLERVDHPQFPFRLTIIKGQETLLALRVADRWPGSRGNIFCLRETGRDWPPPVAELERVPVVSLRRFGKRLSVVLDRSTRRRCDFLFLIKRYKQQEGEYEQIFWQTQKGLQERRPRARFTIYGQPELHIMVETHERYPWQFPGCKVERGHLPVGDYALLEQDEIAAVVERKTFDNMLKDLSDLRILHQRLGELEAYPQAAMVIEAEYADFLNPQKNKPLGTPYCTRALAETSVLHPRLILHFAGTRKLANEWTRAFFLAAAAQTQERPHPQVREAAVGYGSGHVAKGGLALRVRKAIREEFPPEFTFRTLRDYFPAVPEATLRGVLAEMRRRGEINRQGQGKAARWVKAE